MEEVMNLNNIQRTWIAFQQASGLGPIRDAEHYEHMTKLADALIESGQINEDKKLSDLFGIVCGLIEAYDKTHYPVPNASPVQVLRFLMEQHGLKQSDLPEIGSQGVVSQILSGHRILNARQISALVSRFGVGAEVFLSIPDKQPPSSKALIAVSTASA